VWIDSLLVEKTKCCMVSELRVWLDSLLVEKTKCCMVSLL
jgi:hypothetical protein